MRTSKIVALVATAALLVVGTAFASFAAGKTGWDNSEGVWKYYKNGDIVTNDWAKSGSDYYYLDENGVMAEAQLIEDTHTYYVGEDGKMVKGDWVKLANEDDDPSSEYVYYYFQKTGKAYKAPETGKVAFKTIGDKKYAFDAEGKMLWGWLKADEASLQDPGDSESTAWVAAEYYCGDANDGALRTNAWAKLPVYDVNEDDPDQEYYFRFGTNGKKFVDAVKTVDGKKYAFAADGHMVSSLSTVTPSIASTAASTSVSSYMYFSTAEDGARYAKKWFQVVNVKALDATANADEELHWFYAKSNAKLANNEILTWNGKNYAFKGNGEMYTGLWNMTYNSADKTISGCVEMDSIAAIKKVGNDAKSAVYYFSDSEDDGAMKTGAVKINIDGDDYAFKFETSGTKKGQGVKGYSGGCYYENGLKTVADGDQKYQLYKVTATDAKDPATYTLDNTDEAKNASSFKGESATGYVVISSTGAVVKSGTKKDADGYKIKVSDYAVKEILDADNKNILK